MRSCDRGRRGWAGGPQAAAEPRAVGGSGARGAVVSGEALIERVAPWWGIVRGVPGRGRIVGEELGLRRAPGRSDRGRMLGNDHVPRLQWIRPMWVSSDSC